MKGVNKVILVGNLGRDPEVRYLENNVCVANFTLATDESYKDKQGALVDQTEWHNIVVWRGLAEVAEKYLKKGSGIYLEGKLRTRSWDDKESGVKKYRTEIVADTFIMLDKKEDNQAASPSSKPAESKQPTSVAEDNNGEEYADDLPF